MWQALLVVGRVVGEVLDDVSTSTPWARRMWRWYEDERGANLWLALPRDAGVFLGAQARDGFPCAHPVQVWLDLKGHPERAGEAARHLEETLLSLRSRA